jgi:hypothetical protein
MRKEHWVTTAAVIYVIVIDSLRYRLLLCRCAEP